MSVVAITVSIDKNSNHSKTSIHSSLSHVSPLILTTKQCAGGAIRIRGALRRDTVRKNSESKLGLLKRNGLVVKRNEMCGNITS